MKFVKLYYYISISINNYINFINYNILHYKLYKKSLSI